MRPYKADIGWETVEGVLIRLLNLVRVFHKSLNVAVTGLRAVMKKRRPFT